MKKKGIKIVFAAALSIVLALTALVSYAYYTTLPKVYTEDGTKIARLGMRIDLLFDHLQSTLTAEGGGAFQIKYPNSDDTVSFNPLAEWGTAANPYVIDQARHMKNLYSLQQMGYFYDKYIKTNYEINGVLQLDGEGNPVYTVGEAGGNDEPSMPYFLVCNSNGTPVCVNGNGMDIKPIGNDDYPFIGVIGGAQVEGSANTPKEASPGTYYTSKSSVIADFTVNVTDDTPDVGLFGKIGYLGTETTTYFDNDVTETVFNGAISAVSDLLLYDVTINVTASFSSRVSDHMWAHDINSNREFSEDHHIGIFAGHVEYASIENISVYYSSDEIDAVTVEQTNANYLTDSGIIGLVYNLNPSVYGNAIGSSSGSTIAGSVSGAGQEWGGSIDMQALHARLEKVLTEAKKSTAYYAKKQVITIDDVNNTMTVAETSEVPYPTNTYSAYYNGQTRTYTETIRTYQSAAGGSFVFADDNYPGNSERYKLFHGRTLYPNPSAYFPNITCELTTIHIKKETVEGFTIGTGVKNLNANHNGTSASISDVDPADGPTIWITDENNRLYTYLDTNPNNVYPGTNDVECYQKHYLVANANGSLSLTTTENDGTRWTKTDRDGFSTFTYTDNSRRVWYLRYGSEWVVYPFLSTFRIKENVGGTDYYLGSTDNSNVSAAATTEANALDFAIEGNKIVTFVGGNIRYLTANGDLLTLSPSAPGYDWSNSGDTLSVTNSGITWNLRFDSVNHSWDMFPTDDSYTISSSTYYIGVSGSSPVVTDDTGASKWFITESDLIYTVSEHQVKYLKGSADGTGNISLTTNPVEASVWGFDGTGSSHPMYYTVDNVKWYLYKQGTSWKAYSEQNVVYISQSGNYLKLNVSPSVSLGTSSEEDATAWLFTNGKIKTVINGTEYYLGRDGINVTVEYSDGAAATWTQTGTQFYTNGWPLVYDGGWRVFPSLSYIHITDRTNYLTCSRAGVLGNSTSYSYVDARWFVMPYGTQQRLMSAYGDYLVASTTGTLLSTDPDSGNATVFDYDSVAKLVRFSSGGAEHYVVYDGGWTVKSTSEKGLYISTSNGGNTYYLNYNSTSGKIETGNSESSATLWQRDGNKFYTTVGNSTYYLRAALETNNLRSSTNLTVANTQASGTDFNFSGGDLSCTLMPAGVGTTYHLSFDDGALKMVDTDSKFFIIQNAYSTGHYLSATGSTITDSNNNPSNAVLLSFENEAVPTSGTPNVSGTVSTLVNGAVHFLQLNGTCSLSTVSQTLQYHYYQNYYFLRYYSSNSNNYYLEYYQGAWNYYNYGNTHYSEGQLNRIEVDFDPAFISVQSVDYVSEETAPASLTAAVSSVGRALTNIVKTVYSPDLTHNLPTANTAVLNTCHSASYNLRSKTVNMDGGGHDTYFPLVASDSAEDGFAVDERNTGYIVGGSNNTTFQQEWGDVRIAWYDMNKLAVSIGGSYSATSNGFNTTGTYGPNKLEVLTQTYKSEGALRRISDDYNSSNNNVNSNISSIPKESHIDLGLTKYANARAQLGGVFDEESDKVYGMHFMDAVIDMDHLITAPYVVINGNPYYNYELPEDSIDFRLRTKGYITFFAATYFANITSYNNSNNYTYSANDGFFSLYHIIRPDNKISEIKKIELIYGVPDNEKKPYIYKYENEADPVAADRLLPEDEQQYADYVLMFNTNWIEHPTMKLFALYYYEIPVNAGEYALGSVEGGLGAYLCYLDIGTSAADHTSVIGSIDFVYDNSNLIADGEAVDPKIVVVPEANSESTSLNYYIPSLCIVYSRNDLTDGEGNYVKINTFTITVVREVDRGAAKPEISVTFGSDHMYYLNAVIQNTDTGDALDLTPASSP